MKFVFLKQNILYYNIFNHILKYQHILKYIKGIRSFLDTTCLWPFNKNIASNRVKYSSQTHSLKKSSVLINIMSLKVTEPNNCLKVCKLI